MTIHCRACKLPSETFRGLAAAKKSGHWSHIVVPAYASDRVWGFCSQCLGIAEIVNKWTANNGQEPS